MSTRGKLLLALVVAVALGFGWWWSERASTPEPEATVEARPSAPEAVGPVRPREPPVPGRDAPPQVDEPAFPPDAKELRRAAYQEAVAEQAPRPGEKAFRAMVAAFMEHNQELAEAQAAAEGLELDEVEELTFFGLMAQETQRWPEVERVMGGPVDEQTRAQAATLLDEMNAEFKQSMRDLVKEDLPAEDRWALIRSVQEDYRERYFDITGMDEDMLDDLLAGDPSREGAPGTTPPPEDMPPREEGLPPVETREGEPLPR